MDNAALIQIVQSGFWFVDIPRTSSSSIKVELGREFGFPYGKSNLTEKNFATSQVVPDHLPASYMRECLGHDAWDNLYTFTFIRNPWDRMVSMYFYRLLKGHYTEELTFHDYIKQLGSLASGKKPALFANYVFYLGCSDYIFNGDNGLVNYIGYYENRESDIRRISAALECPELGQLFIQKSASDKKHYSQYYDEETKEIVRNVYSNDIKRFGYKFESQ